MSTPTDNGPSLPEDGAKTLFPVRMGINSTWDQDWSPNSALNSPEFQEPIEILEEDDDPKGVSVAAVPGGGQVPSQEENEPPQPPAGSPSISPEPDQQLNPDLPNEAVKLTVEQAHPSGYVPATPTVPVVSTKSADAPPVPPFPVPARGVRRPTPSETNLPQPS